MGENVAHVVAIPLRTGEDLRITGEGIHIGERFFTLARIQDARQVAPDPETVALRVAGAGMVEFQPAQPGDGAIALEALFRLRPELRPAGFAPVLPYELPIPALPAPMGPNAPTPGHSRLPEPRAPMLPIPVPPEIASAYGPEPNRRHAELTPYPRSFGQLLSAILRLYSKHLGIWLALGFVTALLPTALTNGLGLALDAQRGIDPLAGRDVLTSLLGTSGNTQGPSSIQPDLYDLLALLLPMLTLVLSAWSLAALTVGSRGALLAGRISFAESIGLGLNRLWKTLGATLLVVLLLLGASLLALLISIVLVALLSVVALPFAGSAALNSNTPSPWSYGIIAIAVVIAFLPVLALSVRLALAPTLAALGHQAPVRQSMLLTRRQWWRTFGVLLLTGLPTIAVGLGTLAAEYVSVGLAVMVLNSLAQMIVAPYTALAHTALVYDLRLRREGYLVFMRERVTHMPEGALLPDHIPTTRGK